MQAFAERLQERARELGLSNAEVARRADLSPRRYANYVQGQREPDLATLMRIARVLSTSPNFLLGHDADHAGGPSAILMDRIISAAGKLTDAEAELVAIEVEALARRSRP